MNALCEKNKSIYFNNMRIRLKKLGDLIKTTNIFNICVAEVSTTKIFRIEAETLFP